MISLGSARSCHQFVIYGPSILFFLCTNEKNKLQFHAEKLFADPNVSQGEQRADTARLEVILLLTFLSPTFSYCSVSYSIAIIENKKKTAGKISTTDEDG